MVPDAMETAIEILSGQLGASALFISPPGFMYWERNLQKFVYLLMVVCNARRLDFAICALNLRVGTGDLRPAALSYLAHIASISEVVQSVDRFRNSQLTIDDAIFYDHGMSMSRLTFDQQGRRLTREATATEREQFAATTGWCVVTRRYLYVRSYRKWQSRLETGPLHVQLREQFPKFASRLARRR